MKPNLLIITEYSGIGGGETSLINLLNEIKNKYKLHLLTLTLGELNKYFINTSVAQDQVNYKKLIKQLRFISLFKKMKQLLINKDFVLLNSKSSLYLIPFIKLIKNIPIVYIEHSNWTNYSMSEKWLLHKCHEILAVSNAVKKNIEKQVTLKKQINLFYLGIPLENKGEVKSINDKSTINIGMIGRFQEIKGHDFFVELAAEIMVKKPNINFFIIGGKPFGTYKEDSYEKKIVNMINNMNLQERISLLGERTDIDFLLKNKIDILVIPSKNESFGMVVLEAAKNGVPIVTSYNCEGPVELLSQLKSKELITNRNIDTMSCLILQLVSDNSYYSKISNELIESIDLFDIKNNSKILEIILSEY